MSTAIGRRWQLLRAIPCGIWREEEIGGEVGVGHAHNLQMLAEGHQMGCVAVERR